LVPQQSSGPSPLGDARPETFDQHIGPVDKPPNTGEVRGVLEIRLDDASAAKRCGGLGALLIGSLDPHDVRTEVGQDHGGMQARSHAGQLDHANAREGGCLDHGPNLTDF
jgi:hypothetical protein